MAMYEQRGIVRAEAKSATHMAFVMLYATFVLVPMAAGIDKFTNALVAWEQYLAPQVPLWFGLTPTAFMQIVGVVEITAGLLMAFRPAVGGYVIAVWLWGIIVNLLMIPAYIDIALRDFVLSIAAIATAKLAKEHRL